MWAVRTIFEKKLYFSVVHFSFVLVLFIVKIFFISSSNWRANREARAYDNSSWLQYALQKEPANFELYALRARGERQFKKVTVLKPDSYYLLWVEFFKIFFFFEKFFCFCFIKNVFVVMYVSFSDVFDVFHVYNKLTQSARFFFEYWETVFFFCKNCWKTGNRKHKLKFGRSKANQCWKLWNYSHGV